jgi:hypothetical protein
MSMATGAGAEIGILFLHHCADEVTMNNLESFRRWNPGMPIVTMSGNDPLPGGYAMRDFSEHAARWEQVISAPRGCWRSSDLLLYAWFMNRRERCQRWLVVEWDAYCAMRVEDFLAPVREFDLVAPCVRWPNREPEYGWFATVHTLPPDLRPFATAVVPFCFLMISEAVLEAVCARVPWEQLGECNGELRFGTVAHACGYVPAANPLANWNITWQPHGETAPVHTGMWHPVKWLVAAR